MSTTTQPSTRDLIVAIIRKAQELGKPVPKQNRIARALGVSQNTVSKHMMRLKETKP